MEKLGAYLSEQYARLAYVVLGHAGSDFQDAAIIGIKSIYGEGLEENGLLYEIKNSTFAKKSRLRQLNDFYVLKLGELEDQPVKGNFFMRLINKLRGK